MLGAWGPFYKNVDGRMPYGDEQTYKLGAEWLKGLDVEDWGSGLGYFKNFIADGVKYTAVDGTRTPYADKVVDLTTYTNETPGLFMRHVLEHNVEWEKVLSNAIASFTRRMALVTFVPHSKSGTEILREIRIGGVVIPDLALDEKRLLEIVAPFLRESRTLTTATQYGREEIFYMEKPT